FPAHAGMSLAPGSSPVRPGSFPRSRGDEPIRECPQVCLKEFSPLTRG
ncbi:hypothetical protein HMPREF1978_01877, partial [Actinomyces graevenitzii F0530]